MKVKWLRVFASRTGFELVRPLQVIDYTTELRTFRKRSSQRDASAQRIGNTQLGRGPCPRLRYELFWSKNIELRVLRRGQGPLPDCELTRNFSEPRPRDSTCSELP